MSSALVEHKLSSGEKIWICLRCGMFTDEGGKPLARYYSPKTLLRLQTRPLCTHERVTKTFVYVAMFSDGESSSIISVHKQHDRAVHAAKSHKRVFTGGWASDGADVWINGCDSVRVETVELEE